MMKPIPFVDLNRQYASIGAELEAEAVSVLRSTRYLAGPKVAGFEQDFAEAHGAAHGLGVGSGTDALHLALWALDIGPGDEVVLPVNTFIATAEAVTLTGARPVFVDHDEFYNMDAAKLPAALTDKTRAVIAVHLYGQPANVDPIAATCCERGISLVEDCAQAHLARYRGKTVGTFGRIGCFSFYAGKNLGACGEAGAVVTNDDELAQRMNSLRQHGIGTDRYVHLIPGHNYRMDEIQAAFLAVKLKHLAEWSSARRDRAARYTEQLAGLAEVQCPEERQGTEPVYHLYVIQADDRDGLVEHLKAAGIGTGFHYRIPLHQQEAYASLGYSRGDFPVAEAACDRILSLPMFPELTDGEIERVCEEIRNYYRWGERRL